MKVALCLSGLLSGYEEAYEDLKTNLIVPLQPDIFIDTWDVVGVRTIDAVENTPLADTTQQKLQTLYRPISIRIEPFRKFDATKFESRSFGNVGNALSMFYKIKKCNDLRQEHERTIDSKYDLAIRARFDMRLKTRLSPEMFPAANECVYVPDGRDYGGLNDQFAVSSSILMNSFAALYDHIETYWAAGCRLHAESLLQYHLENQMIVCRRLVVDYSLGSSPRRNVKSGNTFNPPVMVTFTDLKASAFKYFPIGKALRCLMVFHSIGRAANGRAANKRELVVVFLATSKLDLGLRAKFANLLNQFWVIVGRNPLSRIKIVMGPVEDVVSKKIELEEYFGKQGIEVRWVDSVGSPLDMVTLCLTLFRRIGGRLTRVFVGH